jgi:N-acetylmuramoyl-L-alanine amidase
MNIAALITLFFLIIAVAFFTAPRLHGVEPNHISDVDLIASVILLEAGGEGPIGMHAVANVICNRSIQRAITHREVVLQKMQFSCMNRRSPVQAKADAERLFTEDRVRYARRLAALALENRIIDTTDGATHYHRVGFPPKWAAKLTLTGRYGNHLFYR